MARLGQASLGGRLVPVAFLGFIVLGMPRAAEGVAWPSMAEDLEQRLGALGWLIAVHIAGYFVASISNGEVTRRIGTGIALVASGFLATLSLLAYAVTPNWPLLLIAAFVLGLAGGLIDAATNAYIAINHGARVMGLLHASFGLGATLGPLLMTSLIAGDGAGWRLGFAILAVPQALVTAAFWRTRHHWGTIEPPHRSQRLRPTRLTPLLLAFVLVAGVEGGTGAWAFTFLSEELTMTDGVAGLWVTGFFACFTLGRLAMGMVGDRMTPTAYLRVGKVASLAGITLLWWSPTGWIAGLGLLAVGLGIAPIFPTLMLVTPSIVGPEHAHDVVGYELGAATVGVALVPVIVGVGIDTFDTWIIPIILAVAVVAQALVVPDRPRPLGTDTSDA